MKTWPLTEEPGTCGGCKHFRRWTRPDGSPGARGKCAQKPDVWVVLQRHGCKTYYEPKEA